MIGHTASPSGSIAATISAAAIATVSGGGEPGISGSVVLARSAIQFAPWPTGYAEQAGNRRAQHKDPNHPDENLAQIPAPSAVDTLKGNRR
ncbi:hypothetical protein [Ensifer sp. SSB1]|jgi:hypothetical protein|uniref:hypothetical protein n=1 Tax=Ensifer sp. SSB1 TaxID=2795385 RepID=UPI001A459F42|nr:hypothetical protein [Ensifer sp. SSB1]MBK5566437.1 hypothetical protein [Ensifer sp. SSB1]